MTLQVFLSISFYPVHGHVIFLVFLSMYFYLVHGHDLAGLHSLCLSTWFMAMTFVDKQNSLIYQYKPSDVLNEIITPLTLVRTGGRIQDKAACQN